MKSSPQNKRQILRVGFWGLSKLYTKSDTAYGAKISPSLIDGLFWGDLDFIERKLPLKDNYILRKLVLSFAGKISILWNEPEIATDII